MADPTTPNMGLILPVVNGTLSPTWAQELNSDLSTIDQHDHSTGSGNQVTPAGLSISSDLPFLTHNATQLRSTRYIPISLGTLTGTDIGCIVVSGVDLYYVDSNGNQIRLTQSGGIAGTPGSISNLTSPASASYVAANATFVWQSNSNVAANMDAATYILRYPGSYPSPAGNYIALEAPSSLATGYAWTFPATLPGAQSFLTLDNTGQVATGVAYSHGITNAQIAAGTITGTEITNNVDLQGDLVLAGHKAVVVSNTNAAKSICIIRGKILANGNLSTGEGFSSVRTGQGTYAVTFTTAFGDVPAVTCSTEWAINTIAQPLSVTANGFTLVVSTGASFTDNISYFTVMGLKA